jgi:uncharacterized protein (AIM24 family)
MSSQPPVYQIVGDDCQVLNATVREGDEWVCEPGTMMHKSPSVRTDAGCGGCGEACSRKCSGESAFKVTYRNRGPTDGYLGLTPNFPAKIIPLDLSEMGSFHCRQGYYMCHYGDVNVSITCDTNVSNQTSNHCVTLFLTFFGPFQQCSVCRAAVVVPVAWLCKKCQAQALHS